MMFYIFRLTRCSWGWKHITPSSNILSYWVIGITDKTENFDILGNVVESAIQATKKALYDLGHPVVYTPRSIEVQQARIKEGEFYRAFLEKLEKL